MLDKPTAALDVQARHDRWRTLEDHARRHAITVVFSTHYLEEADQHVQRIVLIGAGHVTADGTPDQVKAAAGAGCVVRFRLLQGDPDQFATTAGVTAVSAEGGQVTLRAAETDATLWALYPQRHAIADIAVAKPASKRPSSTSMPRKPAEPSSRPSTVVPTAPITVHDIALSGPLRAGQVNLTCERAERPRLRQPGAQHLDGGDDMASDDAPYGRDTPIAVEEGGWCT